MRSFHRGKSENNNEKIGSRKSCFFDKLSRKQNFEIIIKKKSINMFMSLGPIFPEIRIIQNKLSFLSYTNSLLL